MEIVVIARHTEVSERFRRHLEEKLAKVAQLAPRVQRLDVAVTHESNPRQAQTCERVEITVRAKGPVIRAEARADDPYAALDLAQEKLLERLRRARDRRKVHHGRRGPTTIRAAAGAAGPSSNGRPQLAEETESPDSTSTSFTSTPPASGAAASGVSSMLGESPVVIREKTHAARPMSLDDALYEMELVGHDFYLFIDSASMEPSVVYRRRGWSYGVIRLSGEGDEQGAPDGNEPDAAVVSG